MVGISPMAVGFFALLCTAFNDGTLPGSALGKLA